MRKKKKKRQRKGREEKGRNEGEKRVVGEGETIKVSKTQSFLSHEKLKYYINILFFNNIISWKYLNININIKQLISYSEEEERNGHGCW